MAYVLFIDDEPDTLVTLKKAVELFGHQAGMAYSAEEAFKSIQETHPDLVFVDMNLADTSGLAVIHRLRAEKNTASLPVIVLSAGPELDAAARVQAAGAQAYMLKPVRLQSLLEAINQYAQKPVPK
ncbi:MAG: response regulator [Chloroflexota bacterium]